MNIKILHNTIAPALTAGIIATSISSFAGDTSKEIIEIPQQDSWEYSLSPYLLMADLSGDVGLNGKTAAIDAAFEDLADNLEIGGATYFEARKGKWGYGIDGLWMKLSGDDNVSVGSIPPVNIGLDLEVVRLKGTVLYRVHETSNSSFDFYAGVTYNYVDMQVDIAGGGMIGATADGRNTEGWFDPVIGFRYSHDFSNKWFVRILGEIGGWVESDTNWEAMAVLGYHINDNWDVGLAYRGIGTDYEEDGFLYDVTMNGPMLGFSYNW